METDVEGCYKLGARTSQIALYDRDILQKMHNDINGDEVKFPNLPESSKTNDVNDDVGRGDVNCGWFSCCPRWLQKMCNASWLLFVMSMATFFQGFFISGCIPSSITSLERRFGFSSQQTGLLISTFDIVTIILVLPVVYIGGRGHKIRWVSVGSILIAIAAGLFALPHFTSPVYSYGGSTGPSFLCTTGNASVDECASSSSTRDSSDLQNYYYMFVGAMIIGAIGSLPLYTLGIAVLDESVTSTNNGIYMGIFFALGALGPGCGYLLAGLFLSFFTELEQPEGLTLSPQDPGWVGAWWIGFLISSGMLLIIALPMSLFPHELPTTAKIRAEKGDQSHKNSGSIETSQAGFGKKPSDFIKAIKFLIVNPTFMFTVLGGVADTLFTVSFGTFLPKFFENQFSISASLATILTGIIVVIGGIIGTLTGGMIMRKLKLKVPGLLKLIIIANVLNGLMLLITLLHCPPAKLAGVTTSYENTKLTHNTAANVSHSCNSACSCAADSYIPVCAEGSDMEYLSPCHAGCIGEFENGTFTECACLGETNMSTSNRVSFAACSSSCPLYYPFGYAAVTAIVVILGFTCSIPEINVLLRRAAYPAEPESKETLEIPDEWTLTGDVEGQRFLIYDSGPGQDRLIVYATDSQLRRLVYCIRAEVDDGAVSCVYALMSGKSRAHYVTLFNTVMEALTDRGYNAHAPRTIVTDFEEAARSAILFCLGNVVQLHGCFFHLTQRTWVRVTDNGLRGLYMQDEEVRTYLGMMDGLAFLPPQDVLQGMAFIRRIMPTPALQPVVDSFDRTYVNGTVRADGQVTPPRFPPEDWNVHEITLHDGDRTNNICEGWNNSFGNLVGRFHPPFWTFLSALRKDWALTDTQLQQSALGIPVKRRKRRTYVQHQHRLKVLCQRYDGDGDMEGFLRAIGPSIRINTARHEQAP